MMSRSNADALIAEMTAHPEDLPDYIRAVEHLLEDRSALLKLIPACPVHGDECSPHAREWIGEQRAKELGMWESAP